MKTPEISVAAGPIPAEGGPSSANMFVRALQKIGNFVSTWWQPARPMLDFTDEYFDEIPQASRRGSYKAWLDPEEWEYLQALSLAQEPFPYAPTPPLSFGRLSAAHTAMLLLAGPGLKSALDSISNPLSSVPGPFSVDPCWMLCVQGADAALVQRRIWEPQLTTSKESKQNSNPAIFGGPSRARSLLSAMGVATFLGGATIWNDAVLSNLAVEQLSAFMGKLPQEEWQTYLKLRTDIRNLTVTISSDFQARVATWEKSCVDEINQAIKAEIGDQSGGELDCRNAWLQTEYYTPHSRSRRDLAEGQLVKRRHTVKLWDAARQGFSFAVALKIGDGRRFGDASFISRDRAGHSRVAALSVSKFAAIVRTVDPGARAGQLVDELLDPMSAAGQKLQELLVKTLRFDIMDANRSPAETGVDAATRHRLGGALTQVQGNNDWHRYRAEFGITVPALGVGQWVQLPFFTYDIEGVGIAAHAMGRPGGALRVFSDLAQAKKWLEEEVDLTAPWLQVQLSADDRERAVELRKADARAGEPLPGLNPVASLLRDAVTALLPKPVIKLAIDSQPLRRLPHVGNSHPIVSWTLASPSLEFAHSRIAANAARLATPGGALDWIYAAEAGLKIISEILELLVTPAPGGVAGLNRLRTVAFGTYIGMSAAKGGVEASRGDGQSITGAALDILDLAVGVRLGETAALARIRQQGYRRVPLGKSAAVDGLWRFDVDAMKRPDAARVNGQQPSNDGIIRVLGQSFVRMELPSGTTVVLSASRGSDGTWRLCPRDPAEYAPAIKRSGNHWTLNLDDTSSWDDAALLSRSLSVAGTRATHDAVKRLQDITGVTRAELDRIWDGEPPPSWFNDAANRVKAGDVLNRMLSTSPRHDEPVHVIGEAFYVQFLADTLGQRIQVVDENGVTDYLLNPRAGPPSSGAEFSLHRQTNGFYGATANAPRGKRAGIPGILDVVLEGQPSLGWSHVPSPGVTAWEARRQLVNKASDAWVNVHAREIERAVLCVFDLEISRQANAFLAAARAAVGRRLPVPDKVDDAAMANLQYRYPGLTRADALAVLADQTLGPLARGEPDADGLTDALSDLSVFSRVIAARYRALSGRYDADSEALLLTGLTSHPAWPADRSIEVFQGGVDPETGDVISHGVSVARFGRGSESLVLVRAPDGSHRVADTSDGSIVIEQTQSVAPLIGRVIEALPEADRQKFKVSAAIDATSVAASMDIPATSKVLRDVAAQGVRATTPLADAYIADVLPDSLAPAPEIGYYSAALPGDPQRFVKVDGIVVRAEPFRGDPKRARLLTDEPGDDLTLDDAPVVRWDRRGHWRLDRVNEVVQRDLASWESPGGGFSCPTTILLPVDGIQNGSTWRALVGVGVDRLKVVFDFDHKGWRSIDNPSRIFRRVNERWVEGAITEAVDTPAQFATLQVPSIPLPPIDTQPLPHTIGYGWTGREPPSATWLATLEANAKTVREGAGGWTSQLHVDLDDAAHVQSLKTTLAPAHVQVNDLRRDPAFLDWLKTPAGELYAAARDGTHPCYAAAVDVLRFGWILKRHGGIYLDMDDVVLKDWARVGDLRAGPSQLLSGGPVNQVLLELDWDINTSHLGSQPGNPLLDRVVDTMVERAARKPNFFNVPRRGSAQEFARELSSLTGPGVLRDVLEQHAPEIPGLIGAMRVLKSNDIRYEALELAVADAMEAYFPLAQRIEAGQANSWVPSDE